MGRKGGPSNWVKSKKLSDRRALIPFGIVCLLYAAASRCIVFQRPVNRISFADQESGAFWSKHFYYAEEVPWDDYALSLFLDYASRHVSREQVAMLGSYIDENRDGRVTLEESNSFVIRYGDHNLEKGDDQILLAMRNALVNLESEASMVFASSNAKGMRGCSVKLSSKDKQYLEVYKSSDLQFPSVSPFTIEAWVKPRDFTGQHVLVSKYNRGKWGQYFLKLTQNGQVFFHREVAPWGQKAEPTLPRDAFSHIAAVYAEGKARVYINGTLASKQDEGAQDSNNETPVLFGAMLEKGKPTDFFDGELDEVRFWNVQRSPEEIHATMHQVLSGSESGLVAYWPFDECTGSKAFDRVGQHHALFRGGIEWVQPGMDMKSFKDTFGCVDVLCP